MFERNETKKGCEYKFYTEFQSHEPEFDYLKSLEIEEKINKIRWCKRQNAAHFLLSTNGKHEHSSHHRLERRALRSALVWGAGWGPDAGPRPTCSLEGRGALIARASC